MIAPRRFLVRYRRRATDRWRRFPKFIVPGTGFRTRAQAQAKLDALRADGFAGHVGTFDHLRVLALAEARRLLGVREQGGNNRGPVVDEIIRANAGVLGEPWCGDFAAWCYRHAGSRAVSRSWAAVRLLGGLSGVKRQGALAGEPGDLVRFHFGSDRYAHVGILEAYVRWNGERYVEVEPERATHVQTIDGNTGDADVSDGRGGEGVERKQRLISLVQDTILVGK